MAYSARLPDGTANPKAPPSPVGAAMAQVQQVRLGHMAAFATAQGCVNGLLKDLSASDRRTLRGMVRSMQAASRVI